MLKSTRLLAPLVSIAFIQGAAISVCWSQTTTVLYDAGAGPAADPTSLPQWSVLGAINGMASTTTDGNAAWMFGDVLVGGGQLGSLNFDFTSMQLYDMSHFGFTLEVEMESLSTGGFVAFGYTGNNFKQTGPDRSGYTPGSSGGVTETITWSFDPLVDATVINSNATAIADTITAWTGNSARLNLADNTSGTSLMNFKLVSSVLTIEENTGSLNLTFDRSTGEVTLTNGFSETALENIIGYSLLSGSGSLDQSGWDKQSVGASQLTNDNDQWTALSGAGISTDLSESVLETTGDGNGGDLAAMTTWSFGNVLRKSPFATDVALELLIDDGSEEGLVLSTLASDFRVEYIGNPTDPADLDINGVVNALDWVKFKAGYGSDVTGWTDVDAYLNGSDINLDGLSNINDFLAYRDLYAAATGSSLELDSASVPEPATWMLALLGLIALGGMRRVKGGGKLGFVSGVEQDDLYFFHFTTVRIPKMKRFQPVLAIMIAGLTAASGRAELRLYTGFDYAPNFQIDGASSSNDIGFDGPWSNPAAGVDLDLSSSMPYPTGVDVVGQPGKLSDLAGGTADRPISGSAQIDLDTDQDYYFSLLYQQNSARFAGVRFYAGGTEVMQVGGGSDRRFRLFFNNETVLNLGDQTQNQQTYLLAGKIEASAAGPDPTFLKIYQAGVDAVGAEPFVWDLSSTTTELTGLIDSVRLQAGTGGTTANWMVDELRIGTSWEDVASSANAPGATVNLATGEVILFGGDTSLDVTSYSLTSSLGQLVFGNLTSLESQNIGDPAMDPDNGIGFEILSETNNDITEADLTGATVFDNNTSLSLGNIFNTATNELDRDLEISFTTLAGNGDGQVIYISGLPVDGDYNGNGIVDAADYTLWRDNRGANVALPNENPSATTPGAVDQEDYAYWKSRFGAASGSGSFADASAVPEPSTAALMLLAIAGAITLKCRNTRRPSGLLTGLHAALVLIVAWAVVGRPAQAAVTAERLYTLGDENDEGAVADQPVGSATSGATFDSAGTLGAGDLQDLNVHGAPMYVDVSDRPGASGGDLGASFDGANDSLSTAISMNAPAQMWDNATLFPGPPVGAIFPHNYEGIFSHGIQLWAKPDQSALGTATQTLVWDTAEHGIGITAGGNWELLFDKLRLDTGVSVASTLDENGWAHVMQIAGYSDRFNGSATLPGALLVNGIAVSVRGTLYDPATTPLVIGAQSDGAGGFLNRYDGTLDDVELFLWGDNSNQLGQDLAVGGSNTTGGLNADGQDWGTLDLGTDNDWIAMELAEMNVIDRGDVDLSGGSANAADVTNFLSHWRKQFLVNGIQIGDWNSRQEGDLNYDGIVDLRDARILHNSLLSSGASGFDFSLLSGGTGVPEPSTCALAAIVTLAMCFFCRRIANQSHGIASDF